MDRLTHHRPRVFISYSHDAQSAVWRLTNRLRAEEIDCRVDRDLEHDSPPQGWTQWMIDEIDEADYVLVVCTQTYERRASRKEAPGTGALWEGGIVIQQLYFEGQRKFIPIVFSAGDLDHIPVWLRSETHYDVDNDEEYQRLHRRLTGDSGPGASYARLVPKTELTGSEDEIFSIAFSPDGRLVAGASERVVLLWDLERTAQPKKLIGARSYVYSVAFSKDGKLAAGGEDRIVRVWNLDTRKEIWRDRERRHDDAIYSVAFSSDNGILASAGYDRKVNLWNAETGQFHRDLHRESRITSVAFSPQEQLVAIGCLDDTVALWNLRTEDVSVLPDGHTSSVETIAFSPDGRLLASSGLDKNVCVWDVHTRQLRWRRRRHEYLVRSVAFSPDGATLASASWDKTVALWNVEKETFEGLLPWSKTHKRHAHTDWIWSVAFSSSDVLLATGGSDGRVILWAAEETA